MTTGRCGAAVRHRPLAPAAQAARGPSRPAGIPAARGRARRCSRRRSPACPPGGSSTRSARSSAPSASTPRRTTQATRLPDHEATQPLGPFLAHASHWLPWPSWGPGEPSPPGGAPRRAVLPGPPRRGRREGCAPSRSPRAGGPAGGTSHGNTRPGPDRRSAPDCGSRAHVNGMSGEDPRGLQLRIPADHRRSGMRDSMSGWRSLTRSCTCGWPGSGPLLDRAADPGERDDSAARTPPGTPWWRWVP